MRWPPWSRRRSTEKGVVCTLGCTVTGFQEKEDRILVSTDRGDSTEADIVLVTIGVRPENRLAREAGLEIGPSGGIGGRVHAHVRSRHLCRGRRGGGERPGDRRAGIVALAAPANKQGRIAADNAMGRASVYRGGLGTFIAKVFDLSVAATGASEKRLSRHNIPYFVGYTHPGSHASYYPGAPVMAMKVSFRCRTGPRRPDRRERGRDKRIDVLASAMKGGMTVYDLEELELAYAPPYSSGKDPVNMAGFVGANILKGDVAQIVWHDLPRLDPEKDVVIDLRNPEGLRRDGTLAGALHIPLPGYARGSRDSIGTSVMCRFAP